MLKDPPKFVTNIGAWEYVLAKLADKQAEDGKQRLDQYGNPLNYAAAIAYYKNAVKRYPAFQSSNAYKAPYKLGQVLDGETPVSVEDLDDRFPAGQMFWYDDVLCEAVAHPKLAVYPDADGLLFIRARVLDVDPEGAHKTWAEGFEFDALPHRCADFVEV